MLKATLRIAWLSIGEGRFLSLDVGVIVALPDVKIVILGVARAEIPKLGSLLHLRLDVVGLVDPSQRQIAVDASLVDSHALGVFTIFGDGALRLHWGSQGHALLSVGGFYPGFNPEPARLPALRRVGLDLDSPLPTFDMHAEGYFAVTTNSFQLGARIEASISMGIGAHGFLQVDALVQFRPFQFVAECSAGFSVHAGGFHFGGVRLDGTVSGPGPLTVRGRLTIETFLFDISWDERFTFGSGPTDALTAHRALLDVLEEEMGDPANVRAMEMEDPAVLLKPRAVRPGFAAIPPVGRLRWSQRRAPLGLLIDRVDGMPLPNPQGAAMDMAGTPIKEAFAPGNFCTRTSSQALGQPAFDLLDAGLAPDLSGAKRSPSVEDAREVRLVVIRGGAPLWLEAARHDLSAISGLVAAGRKPATLSDATALIVARREPWTHAGLGAGATYDSASAAHQATKRWPARSVALAMADAAAPVSLAGI